MGISRHGENFRTERQTTKNTLIATLSTPEARYNTASNPMNRNLKRYAINLMYSCRRLLVKHQVLSCSTIQNCFLRLRTVNTATLINHHHYRLSEDLGQ